MAIGDILKAARKRAGLTHEQLAESAGLDQGHISKVENGKKSISVPKIEAWIAACGERLVTVPIEGAADLDELDTLPPSDRVVLIRLGRLLPLLSEDQRDMLLAMIERWERQRSSPSDSTRSTERATTAKSA